MRRALIVYTVLMAVFGLRELGKRLLARDGTAFFERLGRTTPPTQAPHLWLHAASNGEAMSAKPVIERLLTDGHKLLLTVNTDTAVAMVRNWHLPGVSVHLAPIDLGRPTRRVYRRWNIRAHVTFESDLWPKRILLCPGPVVVLGARLTKKSAKGWSKLAPLARAVVAKIDYLSAQDTGSEERITAFGIKPGAVGPVCDLKALYTPKDEPPDDQLRRAFDRDETWLAASTHAGEEESILAAHIIARKSRPDLRLILAPRHPRRADEIEAMTLKAGLTVARRSRGDAFATAQVYLADTMGEMHIWYALAGITFVAGSLADRGGHTPYEPSYFHSTILHGPDTGNFLAAYARLQDAQAARCVQDAASLGQALLELRSPEVRTAMTQAAQHALAQPTDLDGLMRNVIHALRA